MEKENKIFSFDEVVDFLKNENSISKNEAELTFANYLARKNKAELVPHEVADKLINETSRSFERDLLQKANFEVLAEIQKGQKKVK